MNVWVWPNCTEEAIGETVTEMAIDVTVMVAAADLVLSASEVAVRVTAVDGGRVTGAV